MTAATANMKDNSTVVGQATNSLAIKVDIPCSGHAPLIIDELKKLNGVDSIGYTPLNTFTVNYNSQLTNEAAILSLEIFKTYKATKI